MELLHICSHSCAQVSPGYSLQGETAASGFMLCTIGFAEQCQIVSKMVVSSAKEFLLLHVLNITGLVRLFILASLVGEDKDIVMFLILFS